MTVTVTFRTNSSTPFVVYANELIRSFMGLELVTGNAKPIVAHGVRAKEAALVIPQVAAYTARDIPLVPTQDDYDAAHQPGVAFPYDLYAAMRFWLADEGHIDAPESAFDQHDRLRPEASVQGKLGLLNTPLVNSYLLHFRYWVEARLGVRLPRALPSGRKCVVALSHDVDVPIDPGAVSHALWMFGACLAKGRVRKSLGQLRTIPKRIMSRLRRPTDRHWLFQEVADAEARHGFTSTFFFAPTPHFWPSGGSRDVPYDIRSPGFRKTFDTLKKKGAEVGLHIGYEAREEPGRILDERTRLQAASQDKIQGARHHYWHMAKPFWPTLEAHAAAGLTYDCSIAFNEAPGWRLGIGFPFKPWNPQTCSAIDCIQLPTMVMDGAYFYKGDLSPQQAVDAFAQELEMLKTFEGCAAIDWHVRTAYPASKRFEAWGEAYLGILECLSADPEVLVTTCAEAAQMGLS